jgi:hypothetical protein
MPKTPALHLLIVLTLVAALAALAACSDDKEGTTPTGGGDTPTAGPTGEASPAGDGFSLPESGVSTPLSTPYGFNADQSSRNATPDEYPFPAGSVSAVWYQSGGLYVVYFEGFPLDEPLCPGASIQLASGGFQDPANSPTGPGGCDGVPTLKPPPTGPYICDDDLVLFLTEVSTETDGVLYASTNRQKEDGSGAGMLGSVQANLEETPEVDLSGCEPPTG